MVMDQMVESATKITTQMIHGTGIFAYMWHKFMVNVGKYSSPMEHMGVITPYNL